MSAQKYVIIKDGGSTPSLFADFVQVANTKGDYEDETPHLNFYTRMDYAMRLVRNRSVIAPEHKLAVAHYGVNQRLVDAGDNEAIQHFRPIDFDLMITALEKYEYVMFGYHSNTTIVNDYTIAQRAIYVVRENDALQNYETGERLPTNVNGVAHFTCLFSLVKLQELPIYYMVMDPALMRLGDDVELKHNDISYLLLTDHDGTLKDNLFKPTFDPHTIVVGNQLIAVGDRVSITFFDQRDPTTMCKHINQINTLPAVDVDTDLPYAIAGTTIHIDITKPIGYFKVRFSVSRTLNVSRTESPMFEYVIHRT